jgi:hypothetical protein
MVRGIPALGTRLAFVSCRPDLGGRRQTGLLGSDFIDFLDPLTP